MICGGVGGTNQSIFILGFCFSFIILCGAVQLGLLNGSYHLFWLLCETHAWLSEWIPTLIYHVGRGIPQHAQYWFYCCSVLFLFLFRQVQLHYNAFIPLFLICLSSHYACLSVFKLSKEGSIMLFIGLFTHQGLSGGGFLPLGARFLVLFRWATRSSRWATTIFLVCADFVTLRFPVL